MKKLILITLLALSFSTVKAQKIVKDTLNNWEYSDKLNEMTGKKVYFAIERSYLNDIQSLIQVCVRYTEETKKNEVLLTVGSGLFNVGVYGITISVKFDNGEIEKFDCTRALDNDYSTVFISKASKFIKEAENSKTMMIEVWIYGKNDQIYKFDTEGLKWDYLK